MSIHKHCDVPHIEQAFFQNISDIRFTATMETGDPDGLAFLLIFFFAFL